MNAIHCSVSFTIWNCFLSAMLMESTCHKCIYGDERECENASTVITNLIRSFKCSFMDVRCAAMSLKTAQQTLALSLALLIQFLCEFTFTDRFGHEHEHGSIRLNCPMVPYRAQLLTWKIDHRFIAIRHRFDFHKHFIIFRTNCCFLHCSLVALNQPINQNDFFLIYGFMTGNRSINSGLIGFFVFVCFYLSRLDKSHVSHQNNLIEL